MTPGPMRDWSGIESGLLLNERIADLETDFARWVYVACILAADSYGCLEDNPRTLVPTLVPLLGRSADDLDAALWDLVRVGLLERLEGPSGRWVSVRRWEEKAAARKIRRRGNRRWPSTGEVRDQAWTSPAQVQPTPPARAGAVSCPVSVPVPSSLEVEQRSAPTEPSGARKRASRTSRTPKDDPRKETNRAFAAWWEDRWEQARGEEWSWSARERTAVDRINGHARGDLAAMKQRAENMLAAPDAWIAQNASLGLLESRWNQFAVVVVPKSQMSKSERLFAELAEEESRNGQS